MSAGTESTGGEQGPLRALGLLVEALAAVRAGPLAAAALASHLPSLVWMVLKRAEPAGKEPFPADMRTAAIGLLLAIPVVAAHAAIILGTLERMGGRSSPLGDLLGRALSRLLPALGVAFAVIAAVGLGLVLFVVPSLVLACMLFAALPAVVVEGGGVLPALARSAWLTQGSRWAILRLLAILGCAQVEAVLGLEALRGDGPQGAAYLLGSWLLQALFTILTAASSALVYARLRLAREGRR